MGVNQAVNALLVLVSIPRDLLLHLFLPLALGHGRLKISLLGLDLLCRPIDKIVVLALFADLRSFTFSWFLVDLSLQEVTEMREVLVVLLQV